MKKFDLKGSIVAIVTPFNDNGEIDVDAFDQLIDWHLENGTDGLVVCGTTGETPALTGDEDAFLIERAVKRVAGRIPIIAGTGSNSTQECIRYSRKAEAIGVDAVLVVSPYYNKPTEKGMYMHFATVAEALEVPIILYNVPSRTGSKISVENAIKLANAYENIVGIKEAAGELVVFTELVAKRPDGFMIYSGDDFLSASANLLGADGCISVIANVIPKEFSQLMKASLAGNVAQVNELFYKYREVMDLMFIESNPIPVKTALAEMGKVSEVFRSPMCTMDDANKTLLVNELRKLDIL
ncbi:4-hydroxy-tetrahydrodipicolinate synthase [Carboxylicivirga sp. M1479]|uniref:4-hydroxy-tetrahydrodipicolinate synthase n=1 Tax=Carboxylicivirga sp. M1479 TaxID=2594476 RepID=UPI001177B322|nr:4-hydroxy-tetrahydrodipicolinate synthase [Carboxylicivirga sp. M1479]TRX66211.1 4-hydroxy-tetrahydrodipicolinate synthase [Carboxylicivirga sp. M1479]